MKMQLFSLLAAAALVVPAFAAEETRTIRLIQDDAQKQMATKVYRLKHLKASDITPYVDAACRRYKGTSQVRSLNAGKDNQSIIVTTAEEFLPYVDQVISVLDRGTKKDAFGSAVYGPGYKWKVYWPKYRHGKDLQLPADVMLSGTGSHYADNGALWIKDDLDDVDYALEWVSYFDRPLPQAQVIFRYYSVRESTLRDVGIDYLAWKNGPGMNLMDFAFNSGRIAWDKILSNASNAGSAISWAYGGIFTAPAFDLSFIRLLQQSGGAKIVASATINVLNNQAPSTIVLTPTYNAQVKDPDDHTSSVVPLEGAPEFNVTISAPTICFFTEDKDVNDMGWIPADKAFYARNNGSFIFACSVNSTDPVEANNFGTQIASTANTFTDWKTIHFGREQVLTKAVREFDVEQTIGVPFLCQLPVLKYIFGTTTTMKEKNYIFVTVEANLVYPDTVAQK